MCAASPRSTTRPRAKRRWARAYGSPDGATPSGRYRPRSVAAPFVPTREMLAQLVAWIVPAPLPGRRWEHRRRSTARRAPASSTPVDPDHIHRPRSRIAERERRRAPDHSSCGSRRRRVGRRGPAPARARESAFRRPPREITTELVAVFERDDDVSHPSRRSSHTPSPVVTRSAPTASQQERLQIGAPHRIRVLADPFDEGREAEVAEAGTAARRGRPIRSIRPPIAAISARARARRAPSLRSTTARYRRPSAGAHAPVR